MGHVCQIYGEEQLDTFLLAPHTETHGSLADPAGRRGPNRDEIVMSPQKKCRPPYRESALTYAKLPPMRTGAQDLAPGTDTNGSVQSPSLAVIRG